MNWHIISDTTLTPAEREDREAESLLRPKPKPSRKHTERRAPRRNQRKGRVRVDDSDLKMDTSDMSLGRAYNRKVSASASLSDIRSSLSKSDRPLFDALYEKIHSSSEALADAFLKYIATTFKPSDPVGATSTRTSTTNIFGAELSEEELEQLMEAIKEATPEDTRVEDESVEAPKAESTPTSDAAPLTNTKLSDAEKDTLSKFLANLSSEVKKLTPEERNQWEVSLYQINRSVTDKNKFIIEKFGIPAYSSKDGKPVFRMTKSSFDIIKEALGDFADSDDVSASAKGKRSKSDESEDSKLSSFLERNLRDYKKVVDRRLYGIKDAYRDGEEYWSKAGEPNFGARAAFIKLLKKTSVDIASDYNIPKELVDLYSLSKGTSRLDSSTFAQKMLEDYNFESYNKEPGKMWFDWAALNKLHDYLKKHATWPKADYKNQQDAFIEDVFKTYSELAAIDQVYKAYLQATLKSRDFDFDQLASMEYEKFDPRNEKAYDDVIEAIDSLDIPDTMSEAINIDKFSRELIKPLEKAFPGSPKLKELKGRMGLSSSYKSEDVKMNKIASYHGVVEHWNPHGDTKGWSYLDKRYIGKDHYDSIIASAKEYMDSGWLKNNWSGSAEDVQHRAALDLAIATADNAAYQSKIDSNVYNMLLNRLSSLDYELFSDTLLPSKKASPNKREASDMADPVQNLLRIATTLQESHPELSVKLVETARDISGARVASDTQVSVEFNTLVRLAFDNPSARTVLMPIIAAKAKAKRATKKNLKKATPKSEKLMGKKSESKHKKSGNKRKASVDFGSDDTAW